MTLVLLMTGLKVDAKPRTPLPPTPEPAVLRHLRFDDAILSPQIPVTEPMFADNIQTVESWSGLSLRMAGEKASIVRYPVVSADGRTNINCQVGGVRFWFKPDWDSVGMGGKGPGTYARLIEIGMPSRDARAGWWSLYFNPQGTAIHFSAQGGGRSADYVQAPILWSANTWHEIFLMYDAQSSQLYVDGQLAAKGAGISVWPDAQIRSNLGFAIGSDMAGGNLAQGEFEELTTYRRPLGLMEWDWVYRMRAQQAMRGVITPEEEQRLRNARDRRTATEEAPLLTAASGPPPGGPPPYSTPGLKVSIPKFANVNVLSGGLLTYDVLLNVMEGQAGGVYELQMASNLNPPASWVALQRGHPGQTNFVIKLNSATPNAFFRLRIPYLVLPPIITASEDTSVLVLGAQVNGFSGSPGTVKLGAAHGFLQVTATSGLSVSGNLSPLLILTGTQEALNNGLASLRYQGMEDYYGPDTLSGLLTNAGPTGAIFETASSSITVTPVNEVPLAAPDAYTVAEDTILSISAPGVLSNDMDFDFDPISVELVGGTSHGTLSLSSDGAFTYLPASNFTGTDSFTYRVTDGTPGNTVTVTLTVTPVNDPPSVSILTPANGASFAVGAAINLSASVTDDQAGAVTVNYYNGATLIGSASSAPFTANWPSPGVGIYTITATATDASGAVGTSWPVTITVSPDCDGDGVSDSVELAQGTDPCDAFNGAAPILTIVGGNLQTGPALTVLPQMLKVRVANSSGLVKSNVAVVFALASGGGYLSISTSGPWTNELHTVSDIDGFATAAFFLPAAGAAVVNATAGTNVNISQVSFAEAVKGPVDGWSIGTNPAIAIAGGNAHSLALMADGTMRAWGLNIAGALGDGTTTRRLTPVRVSNVVDAVKIAAGNSEGGFSFAIRANGSGLAWGENDRGPLGDGTIVNRLTPVPISSLASLAGLSGGAYFSYGWLSNGTPRSWGSMFVGQLGNGQWGIHDYSATPGSMLNLPSVLSMSAGGGHGLAVTAGGQVAAWGYNQEGQLGYSTTPLNYSTTPGLVPNIANAIAVAGGGSHSLALLSNGTVVGWGLNTSLQATPPAGLANVIAIAAGGAHSVALTADGYVWAWGTGQPNGIMPLPEIVAIAAGDFHTLALTSAGAVWAWGDNSQGQLGNGSLTYSPIPVEVSGLPDGAVTVSSVSFKVFTPLK